MTKRAPFRCFKISPEIIRLAVMLYIRFPLSLRNVEDLLHKRAIEISHEKVRFWWNRFGPMFASEIRRYRISRTRCLQKFASGHFSDHNHFYQERHLYSRDNFKLNQTTTLTEWRQLCSA